MFVISAEILTFMIVILVVIGVMMTSGIIFKIIIHICKYFKNKEKK